MYHGIHFVFNSAFENNKEKPNLIRKNGFKTRRGEVRKSTGYFSENGICRKKLFARGLAESTIFHFCSYSFSEP